MMRGVSVADAELRADRGRLWRSLMDLAQIGALPDGGGSNRVALSDADAEGQRLFEGWAREAGCEVGRDAIGNLFARRERAPSRGARPSSSAAISTRRPAVALRRRVGVLGGLESARAETQDQ